MDSGFVKLWRRTKDSRVFRNEGLFKVWVWCLMKASHKKRWVSMKSGKGEIEIEILPGQFVFGRNSAGKELHMKPETARTRMAKLEKMQNLTIEPTRQYSIVSIINWDTYQGVEKKDTIEDTNRTPGKHQPDTTDKNVNTLKKEIYTSNFESFWKAYPRKIGKGKAFQNYQNIKDPRPSLKIIISSIETQNKSEQWQDKQFIPHPATWLSQRRWEDELEPDPLNGSKLSTKETLEKHGL